MLGLHPSHQHALRGVALIVALLALGVALAWALPTPNAARGIAGYLPLHILLEMTSVVVSVLVFAVGWNDYSGKISGNLALLASVFLGVACLDFTHTFSFYGMPDFVTPNGPDKAIYFWLTARALAAAGLLLAAVAPWRGSVSASMRYAQLAAVLIVVGVLHWSFLFHHDSTRGIFLVPGKGLTPLKLYLEYAIIAANVATVAVVWVRMRKPLPYSAVALFGAVCTMAMSEFFFTLYAEVTDVFNLLGHIYKVVSYLFIYRAFVATTIEAPYRQLIEAQSALLVKDAAVESSLNGIAIADTQGCLSYVNPAFCRMWGIESKDAIGQSAIEFWRSAADPAAVMESVNRQGHWQGEMEALRRDGQAFSALVSATMVHDSAGRPIGMMGAFTDITQQKVAENALRESENRLSTIFQGSPIPITVTRAADGVILEINQAALRTFGYQREEALGRTSVELHVLADPAQREEALRRLREQGGIDSFPIDYVVKSGKAIAMEVSGRMLDLRGEQCLVSMMVDVTARKGHMEALRQINEELEQRIQDRTRELQVANRELESFSYSVSHDLRAPLRAIEGFSSLIEKEYSAALDDRGKGYFRRVRTGASRMAALIDDLLKLSRISRQEMQRAPVDLSALVRDVADELQSAEPTRRVEWTIAPDAVAQGDPGLLRIALQNLIGNAWKYSSKRAIARIEFKATQWKGRPAFVVSDNGEGFDMAYADRLFGAFQRLHSEEEFPGSGIGLATVARIIRRHGGEVGAEGKAHEGASFYFTL